MKAIFILSGVVLALVFCACSKPAGNTNNAGTGGGNAAAPANATPAPHAGHGDEGPENKLGSADIAGVKVDASQMGDVKAGAEGVFEVKLAGGATPTAIRMWVGTADGKDAVKAVAEKEEDHFHCHVEVPKTLAAEAMLCVELEIAGARTVGTFKLKR